MYLGFDGASVGHSLGVTNLQQIVMGIVNYLTNSHFLSLLPDLSTHVLKLY